MARIVVRFGQYTGHYVFTGIQTRPDSIVVGGRIYCPCSAADHIWTCHEARSIPSSSRRASRWCGRPADEVGSSFDWRMSLANRYPLRRGHALPQFAAGSGTGTLRRIGRHS